MRFGSRPVVGLLIFHWDEFEDLFAWLLELLSVDDQLLFGFLDCLILLKCYKFIVSTVLNLKGILNVAFNEIFVSRWFDGGFFLIAHHDFTHINALDLFGFLLLVLFKPHWTFEHIDFCWGTHFQRNKWRANYLSNFQ